LRLLAHRLANEGWSQPSGVAIPDMVDRLQDLGDRLASETVLLNARRQELEREVVALEQCVEALLAMLQAGIALPETAQSTPGPVVDEQGQSREFAAGLVETLTAMLARIQAVRRQVFGNASGRRLRYAAMGAGLSVVAMMSTLPASAGPPGSPLDAPDGAQSIIIAPGDTLQNISIRYYGTPAYISQIAEANGIRDPNLIRAGALLTLPAVATETAAPVGSVVVQPGDTLAGISQRVYGSAGYVQEIARANGISNPAMIRAGAQLTLPAVGQRGNAKVATGTQATTSITRQPVQGVATYYGIEDGYVDGTMACGQEFSPADPTVAAVRPGRYPCGTRLMVTDSQSQRSVEVVVKDYCGGCAWDHVDLSRAAFSKIGQLKQGRLDVAWTPVP
jgi:LysM repeat protein